MPSEGHKPRTTLEAIMVGIELAAEKYISPRDIARTLNIHPSAPVRWMRRGTALSDGSRVCLKHLRLPGGFRTTQAWLDAFLARIADDRADKTGNPVEASRPARTARVQEMNSRLAAEGFLS
jgi:hypothetical protein